MSKSTAKNMIGWCLIPPAILSRADISDSQKLLMGRILGLLNNEGYCFATNTWLGNQLSITRIRVSQLLSDLQKKGLLKIELVRNNHRAIIKRKIFPVINQNSGVIKNDNTCYKKVKGVLSKSDIGVLSKSEKVVIENREIEKRNNNHQISIKSDVQEFINFYFKEYRKKFKTDPPFKGGRDGQTVKTLLKVMTLDILKTNVNRFLETEDLFFRKNGYDIPRFEKFLDGIKCGAYAGPEERHQQPAEGPEDEPIYDAAGFAVKTLPPSTGKSTREKLKELMNDVEDETIIDPGTGGPAKRLKITSTRLSAYEKVQRGLI